MASRIKDNLHGYIELTDLDKAIIDSAIYQRLKGIRQLGTAFSVYHGCNHTRFEHSLGVMHLGTTILQHLFDREDTSLTVKERSFLKKNRLTLKYACLFHDLGHGPFSHATETLMDKKELRKQFENKIGFNPIDAAKHEIMSCLLAKQILDDLQDDFPQVKKIEIEFMCRIITSQVYSKEENKHFYLRNLMISILSSNYDCDRLDYILRDNYYSGVSLVNLDIKRLISSITVDKQKRLAFDNKSLSSIQNYVFAREQLYDWIYYHPVIVYTDGMIEVIVKYFFETISIKDISQYKIDENYILGTLKHQLFEGEQLNKNQTYALKLYKKNFVKRDYLKPVWKTFVDFLVIFEKVTNTSDDEIKLQDFLSQKSQFEHNLKKHLGLKKDALFVFYRKPKYYKDTVVDEIQIMVDNNTYPLSKFFNTKLYKTKHSIDAIPFIYSEREHHSKIITYIKKNYKSVQL